MRSVQLVAPRRLEEVALPDPPDPKPGELLVKVRAVGLCGSDLHWYEDGRIGAVPAAYPQILGHEPLVEFVRAGAGVNGFKEGDRLSVEPTITCGHCEYCLAGQHNNCVSGYFMGSPAAFGFFRQFAVIPASNAVRVPDALSDRQAALIEPVAVMAHMLDLARIQPGDTVAITGAGPIGQLCASVAKASGAGKVFICDSVHPRLELAMSLGADMACDVEAFAELVRDETRGRGADVAIEAAGAAQAINACLAVTRPSGTVVLLGITSEISVKVNLLEAMGKELTLKTVKRSNHCAERAIRMLKSGAVRDEVISDVMPLGQVPEAFERALARTNAGKILVDCA